MQSECNRCAGRISYREQPTLQAVRIIGTPVPSRLPVQGQVSPTAVQLCSSFHNYHIWASTLLDADLGEIPPSVRRALAC